MPVEGVVAIFGNLVPNARYGVFTFLYVFNLFDTPHICLFFPSGALT